MLEFTSADGTALRITVLGYEYPDDETDSPDWLLIRVEGRHPRGAWERTDPSMETFDVERLRDWLAQVVSAPEGRAIGPLQFTEPNIEFDHRHQDDQDVIAVRLAHETVPPWVTDRDARAVGVEFEFPARAQAIAAGMRALRAALETYPSRGEE